MKHPIRNQLGGILFFGLLAVSYLIIVNPFQFYLWLRRRPKLELAKTGSWFFKWVFPLLGIMPRVEGLENIPKNQNFIVLANHQSFMDIGAIMTAIYPLAFLAKKELFQVPLFGRSLAYMGSLPVDRNNPRGNRLLPQQLQQNIKNGHNYCVYPEGTRSPDGTLLPFKNGIFRMLLEAPAPILPITLDGTGLAIPKIGLAVYRKRPRVVIHPPLYPAQYASMNLETLRETVRNSIASALPS